MWGVSPGGWGKGREIVRGLISPRVGRIGGWDYCIRRATCSWYAKYPPSLGGTPHDNPRIGRHPFSFPPTQSITFRARDWFQRCPRCGSDPGGRVGKGAFLPPPWGVGATSCAPVLAVPSSDTPITWSPADFGIASLWTTIGVAFFVWGIGGHRLLRERVAGSRAPRWMRWTNDAAWFARPVL